MFPCYGPGDGRQDRRPHPELGDAAVAGKPRPKEAAKAGGSILAAVLDSYRPVGRIAAVEFLKPQTKADLDELIAGFVDGTLAGVTLIHAFRKLKAAHPDLPFGYSSFRNYVRDAQEAARARRS
jgi:hypothetical protein